MLTEQIDDTITKFVDAFNANDLDRVMTFFSEDAVYLSGDGKTHRGKAEIRAAFEPQFNGEFGTMRFDGQDCVIDAEHRKAAFRWVCRHDISHFKGKRLGAAFRKLAMEAFVGNKFGWQGVDVFHFDADGKITGKYSYGSFGSRPHVERALG